MYKFKDIIADKDGFNKDVIQKIKEYTGDLDWLADRKATDKYYNIDTLYFILSNQYNERYIRYDKKEFLGYFYNKFITYTPMFYARVSNIIEDKISELQDNAKVGVKTSLNSKTKRAVSTQPYNNGLGKDIENADEKNSTDYQLDTTSPNIVDNAKKLSQAKINGEVEKYVNSFADLFTSIDMGDKIESAFTTPMRDLLIEVAKHLGPDKQNFIVVDKGGRLVLEPKDGMDIVLEDPSGVPIAPSSPSSAISKGYVDEIEKIINLNLDDIKRVADDAVIDINALKATGITIPHLTVNPIPADADVDTQLKALITSPINDEVAYVGDNTIGWKLYKYDLATTTWVDANKKSTHTTAAHDATKLDITAFNRAMTLYQKKDIHIRPTLSEQPGYIIMDEDPFTALPIGTLIEIDLSFAKLLFDVSRDTDRLFVGSKIPVTIKDNVFLKYDSQTNPTDTTIKPNYASNYLMVEKISDTELRYKEWKPIPPDLGSKITQLTHDVGANMVAITRKQATLTKTITLHFDDGSTEDIKVG